MRGVGRPGGAGGLRRAGGPEVKQGPGRTSSGPCRRAGSGRAASSPAWRGAAGLGGCPAVSGGRGASVSLGRAVPLRPACAGGVPSRARGSRGLSRAPRLRLRLGRFGGIPLPVSLLSSPPPPPPASPPLPPARLTEPFVPRPGESSSPPRACYRGRAGSYRDNGICFLSHVAVVDCACLMASVINWPGAERVMYYHVPLPAGGDNI